MGIKDRLLSEDKDWRKEMEDIKDFSDFTNSK